MALRYELVPCYDWLEPFPVLVNGLLPGRLHLLYPCVAVLQVSEEEPLPFREELVLGHQHDSLGLRDVQPGRDLVRVRLVVIELHEIYYQGGPPGDYRPYRYPVSSVRVDLVYEYRLERVVVRARFPGLPCLVVIVVLEAELVFPVVVDVPFLVVLFLVLSRAFLW